MTDQVLIDAAHAAARTIANTGHALTEAVLAALTPQDRDKWHQFELAGAEGALTVRWRHDRVEVKLGLLMDDAQLPAVYAVEFKPNDAPGAVH
jgi:hypothetical protein